MKEFIFESIQLITFTFLTIAAIVSINQVLFL